MDTSKLRLNNVTAVTGLIRMFQLPSGLKSEAEPRNVYIYIYGRVRAFLQ